jgi:Lar family restriction alleviation protein
MTDTLPPLPCPFCGGAAHTVYIRDGRMARCTKCGASGPGEFHGPADGLSADERAIAAWNRRAALPAAQPPKRDHFCNKCGNVVGTQKHNRPDGKECHYLAVFVGAAPVAAQPTSGVALTDGGQQ